MPPQNSVQPIFRFGQTQYFSDILLHLHVQIICWSNSNDMWQVLLLSIFVKLHALFGLLTCCHTIWLYGGDSNHWCPCCMEPFNSISDFFGIIWGKEKEALNTHLYFSSCTAHYDYCSDCISFLFLKVRSTILDVFSVPLPISGRHFQSYSYSNCNNSLDELFSRFIFFPF